MEDIRDHHTIHHSHQEETEEDDDTLSFCDLPIYSSDPSSEWENEDHSLSSSSSSSSDQDGFEFYSEDWSKSSIVPHNYPIHQNIIFCGKIIPSKDLPVSNTSNNSPTHQPSKKRGIFRWNPKFLGKPRSKRQQQELGCDLSVKSLSMPTSGKYGISLWGVPGLTLPAKSRWLSLLMLGLERLPEEMDLGDNKTKQQRRQRRARLNCPDNRVQSGKASWGLLGVLGCGSNNHHRLHHQHQPCPVIEG